MFLAKIQYDVLYNGDLEISNLRELCQQNNMMYTFTQG